MPVEFDARRQREIEQNAAASLADRIGAAGGLPPAIPTADKTWVPFGSAPLRQVRKVFVAKYNPGLSDPGSGRFLESDPDREDDLWNPSVVSNWISDQLEQNRTAPAFARVAPGDLVMVFRSEPRVLGKVRKEGPPFRARPHLLGVWWVVSVLRRQLAAPRGRPVTDVWHAPLVEFDDPVDVRSIRHRPELTEIGPFTDRTRSQLVEATPVEAAALVSACSLPSWVLTEPDPVSVMLRLRTVRTGERPKDRAYRQLARERYTFIHKIEEAAVDAVRAVMVADGWSVASEERTKLWGADLDCKRKTDSAVEVRKIEVKGKAGAGWHSVVLQASQLREAQRSALARDGVWWLAICTRVLQSKPDPIRQLGAEWVARNWPADQVR